MAGEARLFIATDANGQLSLGGPWAIAEVKGTGVNSVFAISEDTQNVCPANNKRKAAIFFNNGASTVYLCLSATSDQSNGMPLQPGAVFMDNITNGAWWALCDQGDVSELRIIEASTS